MLLVGLFLFSSVIVGKLLDYVKSFIVPNRNKKKKKDKAAAEEEEGKKEGIALVGVAQIAQMIAAVVAQLKGLLLLDSPICDFLQNRFSVSEEHKGDRENCEGRGREGYKYGGRWSACAKSHPC